MKASRRVVPTSFAIGLALAAFGGMANAATLFGTTDTNQLVRFDDASPSVIASTTPITGLQPGEILYGIDFRPANEDLFALGSTSRIYRLDVTTGAATQIGSSLVIPLNGTSFGFDFNPTVDRIRIVSDADQNMRVNPNDGSVIDFDTGMAGVQPDLALAYAAGDPNFGQNPNVVGSAYTNNVADATTTTLYGIDSGSDVLATQIPSNNGTLNTVGSLGDFAAATIGFDIVGTATSGRAAMTTGGILRLYSVLLSTGSATLIGPIGSPIRTMTAAPPGYSASLTGSTVTFTASVGAQSLVFDSAGGLLRHNRFNLGSAGFSSGFDFSSGTPGDQTLSASDANVVVVINSGSGDDRIVIGTATVPASSLRASFNVDGGGGHDVIEMHDTSSAVARTVTLGLGPVTGLSGPVTLTAVESLVINAGGGDDRFNVGNPRPTTTIFAGLGNDRVVFGDGGSLADGLLDGSAGNDVVNYAAYTSAIAVDFTASRTLFLGRASGGQEPSPLSNSVGSGNGRAVLNASQTELDFSLRYRDIAGTTITGAHFHQAVAGINGAIVRDISGAELNGSVLPAGTFNGVWRASDGQSLTTPLVASLLGNGVYMNLHTNLFSSGEIRGQLISQGMVGLATGTGGIRGFEVVDLSLFADGFE